MDNILNSYYLNLLLFVLLIFAIITSYYNRCDYSNLVEKMNKISLTEIGS